ncbi:MAG: XRE family transcriptional regulator [Minwuia sp.]|nr:XRE family transcriptional regulator [Minwuia sp.]
MTEQADIQMFGECLRIAIPDVTIAVDRPDDPDGESWIDIGCGDFATSISYQPRYGFGVHIAAVGYGERPDEIYRTPVTAAKRLAQICLEGRNGRRIRHMTLADLRKMHDTTQAALAQAMHIKQPAVAKKEKSSDQMLGTLAAYVEALGGRIETRVIFDDLEAVLQTNPTDDQEIA